MSEKVNSNFTDEQCKVFSLYSSGFSFFLTGEGGTGKSFVLKEIIQHAGRKLGNEDIAVTAPTGIAANNIGGQTIQSWAGIGLGKGTRYQLLDKVLANEECSARWKKCQLLIVDEVSLLNLYLFEKLEFIARRLRKTDAVFGGIQVIFSGDFFQIPPVSEYGQQTKFCFQSPMWAKCLDFSVAIREVVRQTDPKFIEFLHDIRQGGSLSPSTTSQLNQLTRPIEWSQGEQIVKLFSAREDVEDENYKMLDLLPGENLVFNAVDGGPAKHSLNKRCQAPKTLLLKEGATVMLLKNYPKFELVNGSIGVVQGFNNNYPHVRFRNGKSIIVREYTWAVDNGQGSTATRRQLPLTLGWAITIHKCQGLTLEKAEISLSKLFVQGQAYVALSRVKTLNGIQIQPGFDVKMPTVNRHVLQFYQESVVPVSTINCSDLTPVRMITPIEHEYMIRHNSERPPPPKIVNVWKHVLPLPAAVDLKVLIEKMVKDELISDDTKSLLIRIGFENETIPKILVDFICHTWMKLDKLITMPEADEVVVVSKKNWVGHARSLHQLKISSDLSNRWVEVLTSSGVTVVGGKLNALQRSVMARLVDMLHARLVGELG